MKKNLITLITALTMLASTAAVFAEEIPEDLLNQPASPEDTLGDPVIQGDVMLISGEEEAENTEVTLSPSYTVNNVTVTEITDTQIVTTLNAEDAENPENTVNYTIIDKTIVIGNSKGDVKAVKDIKKGDKITVYTDAYSPAPLILPPQYQADVIVIDDAGEKINNVNVDTYMKDEADTLVNFANTLALNLADDTEIVDREGKKVDAKELDKKDLAVVYNIETRSIPAQTNPVKVIVLGENETALSHLAAVPMPIVKDNVEPSGEADYSKVVDINVGDTVIKNIYKENDTIMVPLRAIAEALGFTVEWDGATKSIMLNSGMYSLKIGENAYGKGKMMPQQLKAAPVIKDDDLTYVPVEYFTELVEASDKVTLNEKAE